MNSVALYNAATALAAPGGPGSKGEKVTNGIDGDINKVTQNASDMVMTIGGGFLALLGTIAVFLAVWWTVTNLWGKDPNKKREWPVVGGLFIVGGGLMFGASQIFFKMASTGKQTLDQLTNGTGGGFIDPNTIMQTVSDTVAQYGHLAGSFGLF